jgi:hypothetical protein
MRQRYHEEQERGLQAGSDHENLDRPAQRRVGDCRRLMAEAAGFMRGAGRK